MGPAFLRNTSKFWGLALSWEKRGLVRCLHPYLRSFLGLQGRCPARIKVSLRRSPALARQESGVGLRDSASRSQGARPPSASTAGRLGGGGRRAERHGREMGGERGRGCGRTLGEVRGEEAAGGEGEARETQAWGGFTKSCASHTSISAPQH